jgi:hypothetical protein
MSNVVVKLFIIIMMMMMMMMMIIMLIIIICRLNAPMTEKEDYFQIYPHHFK